MGLLDVFKRPDIIKESLIAGGFLLVGIVASPAVEDWWDANIANTPERLSNLLQNGDITGFNDKKNTFMKRSSLME